MPKWTNEQKKEKTRKRIWTATDPDRYKYTPAKNHDNYPKTDEYQRVGIYARVSTLNPEQTSSYELQQKYYEELVSRYPKWELVKIYADEGKSGVTIQHREAFNEMMADAYAGKLDFSNLNHPRPAKKGVRLICKGQHQSMSPTTKAGNKNNNNSIPAISKHQKAFLYGWLPLSNAHGI